MPPTCDTISNPAVPGSNPGGRVISQGLTTEDGRRESSRCGEYGDVRHQVRHQAGHADLLTQARRLFGSASRIARHGLIRRERSTRCLIWTGGTGSSGYPKSRVQGRDVQPHRLACALAHPEVDPTGLVARHACDTPRCCNPDHLSFGTRSQNMADAGRSANPPAKRSHRQVSKAERAEITRRVHGGESQRSVARDLGRDPRTVRDVLRAARIEEATHA